MKKNGGNLKDVVDPRRRRVLGPGVRRRRRRSRQIRRLRLRRRLSSFRWNLKKSIFLDLGIDLIENWRAKF